jgi:hypothetical protein
VDQALLVTPQKLPKVPRNADGSIDGSQFLAGGLGLYDVAGKIRQDFMALQAQVKAAQEPPESSHKVHKALKSNDPK